MNIKVFFNLGSSYVTPRLRGMILGVGICIVTVIGLFILIQVNGDDLNDARIIPILFLLSMLSFMAYMIVALWNQQRFWVKVFIVVTTLSMIFLVTYNILNNLNISFPFSSVMQFAEDAGIDAITVLGFIITVFMYYQTFQQRSDKRIYEQEQSIILEEIRAEMNEMNDKLDEIDDGINRQYGHRFDR